MPSARRGNERTVLKTLPGHGIVAARQRTPPSTGRALGGGGANAHHKKFSGPNDATNANVDFLGGSLLTTAQLRLVFWGKQWETNPSVPYTEIVADVESIVGGPYLEAAAQYGVDRAWVDRVVLRASDDPPNPFTADDAGDLIKGMIDGGKFPEPDDDFVTPIYFVFLPPQVDGMSLQLPPGQVGFHGQFIYFDVDLPFDVDIANLYVAWVSGSNRAAISADFSHELVETMTDPRGSSWQVEPTDGSDWNEIGDICSSPYLLNGVTVQSYWSRMDNACVVPDGLHTVYQVQWIYRPSHIEWLGGIDQDGAPWQYTREMVMIHIRAGDEFVVHGSSSGRTSHVGIYYLDAAHSYVATNTDGSPDDNLLSLPQRPPS
jgi:hypothetical protein